jgi:hypothetical protein
MLVAEIDVTVAAQVVAAVFTAVAAVAAWRSAGASLKAVRLSELERKVEHLEQLRGRFERARAALVALRDADVKSRLEALRAARHAIDLELPLGHRHDYPQASYFLSTVFGPEEVHSKESRETVERTIDEMDKNVTKIDDELYALRR